MLYKNIGRRIRSKRQERHLTQEKLAEQAGISLSFLGHIERGSRKLSVDTLYKLVQVLQCSADEILGTGPADRAMRLSARELLQQAMLMAEEAE